MDKMETWQIILVVISVVIYIIVFATEYDEYRLSKKRGYKVRYSFWEIIKIIFAPLYVASGIITIPWMIFKSRYDEVMQHGGYREYREWKKEEEQRVEYEKAENARKREEWEGIKASYLGGEIARTALPRVENGIDSFEFSPEMMLSVDYESEVREIIYVESNYNERLNRFFLEHKDLRLYHMYKFVYLPALSEELEDGALLSYYFPNEGTKGITIPFSSDYPLQYLVYQEDKEKIKQGMFFFREGCDNHGAEYVEGDYYPLNEGTDDEIVAQLDAIVKRVHSKHSRGVLYSKVSRTNEKEGTDEYADEQFLWELYDDDVAIIVEEVKQRINKLKEKGLTEKILLKIFKEKPKLSRLVITKDLRIFLPDYHDMEIKMEPINKAVYLLFLRHPEGIIFKHLPDYRQELIGLYQKIKPLGLNERALRSIEDVTNPCLNSINEKCARIRGTFISYFDEDLAQNYYIKGWRGEAKKISLPRDLVDWE